MSDAQRVQDLLHQVALLHTALRHCHDRLLTLEDYPQYLKNEAIIALNTSESEAQELGAAMVRAATS